MTDMELYRPPATEVAVRGPLADTDSWTTVLAEVADLAGKIANTPFVPDGLRGSVPAVAAAILTGRELGLPPMTSLSNIHVIKGKPALSASLMRALILAQGHQIETIDISDTRAKVRGRRRGESEWEEASFTADQAKQAGIQLGGYPQDKLYARATSRLARRKFADVIAGMPYSAEELEDGAVVDMATGEVAAPTADKPRTAQRKQRTQTSPPAPDGTTPAAESQPPAPAGAGGDLPPLPGEEADYDTEGTVPDQMLTAIWTVLGTVYHFGSDEKDQARGVCSQILGRQLASSKDMSKNEAGRVLDQLDEWRREAEGQGDEPRGYLMYKLTPEAPDEPA